jgi:hypothetical protein
MAVAAMEPWTVMNTLSTQLVAVVFLAGTHIHNRRTVLHTLEPRHTRTDIIGHFISAYASILARRQQAVINI